MKYDYKCYACEKEFVIEHPMSEDSRTECPECGEHKLKKVLKPGAGQFILKGSGWFKNSKSY